MQITIEYTTESDQRNVSGVEDVVERMFACVTSCDQPQYHV